MKKYIAMGFSIVTQILYADTTWEDVAQLINKTTIPLSFTIMHSETDRQEITLAPQHQYVMPFIPRELKKLPYDAQYPDIQINYRFSEQTPLRLLITKDPDDGLCQTEYGIVRPSKLNVHWYTKADMRLWTFYNRIGQLRQR